jgi:hypothetical protein
LAPPRPPRVLRRAAVIVALAASACSAVSPAVAAAADTTPPTVPGNLEASGGDHRVSLKWNPSTDNVAVSRYNVWRRLASARPGTGWSRIAATRTAGYADTAVTNGTGYVYAVYARDSSGNFSAATPKVTATPKANATPTAPTPTPTPTPTQRVGSAPAPSGSVLWRADAESLLGDEWASLATVQHCTSATNSGMTDSRITRTPAVRAQGDSAYRVELRDNDICYANERSELGQGNPTRTMPDGVDRLFRENQERWMSWQMRLEPGFPVNTSAWYDVIQWKQLGSLGSPVLALEVGEGNWQMMQTSSDPARQNWRETDLGSAVTGRWVKFTIHVKFSPNSSVGFVELFGDLADGRGMRELAPLRHASTMKVDGGKTVNSQLRIGLYRDKAISGTNVAYYDGWTIATTRAAAEAGAFSPLP